MRDLHTLKDIYSTIQDHQSIRKYKSTPIPDEDLNMILEAAIHAPSSVNGQQWSVIVIKNPETKNTLASLTGSGWMDRQEWVYECPVFLLFVMDYYKIAKKMKEKGKTLENIRSIEATMVGAVDVGIAFTNAMNVAESMGYGIVPIGAVRGASDEIIDLLHLPQGVFPVLGMCLGYPDQNPGLKPRMPWGAMVHEETYQEDTDALLSDYDATMEDYMRRRTQGEDVRSWTDTTAMFYDHIIYRHLKESLAKQGFTNEI